MTDTARVTIWHNPRCSKSRATLQLLRERGIEPDIRLYLQDPPSLDELRGVRDMLGLGAGDFLRRGEAACKAAGLDRGASEAAILAAMAAAPILIERPIVIAGGRARLGRPPEAVLEILQGGSR